MSTQAAVIASVEVPTTPARAFELWTTGINQWWKKGTPYWNDKIRARGLRFEPGVGGRFLEVYDETAGEGLEIGRISVWEPRNRLVYTWREAGWTPQEVTQVEVRFEPTPGGTRVTVTHSGWETVREGQKRCEGYGRGHNELRGWYREAATAGI
ncbi:MAG: SRPBCC domain-containing protein [Armatimonadota bacterium]|nr:SRPBCC domain-containing protein [Armatimonadota bacterium]MDR7450895.1 SRPBCC domain-containing protein [Armatimonadota bacterium]MDR7465817.1 SRPBCC domain-containing protein [Armatimonadota bacterium]MDR7493725.1 SRPBCC domain-containing protein [Armatimonadota bacterium]MDR7498331.1 SRPBCC domain-containing protein [Armatimonadota bacterium]